MTRRNVVFADIESHNSGLEFDMEPREFFRLGQWAVGRTGDIHLTTDYDEFMHVIDNADLLVFHNGIGFDLNALYGKDSMRPLELALERKVWDPFVAYPLRFRIPQWYTTRSGKKGSTYQDGKQKPELVKKFLALDNLTHQHGLEGKLGNLQELAKKHNPPKTKVADLDYSLIPLDDPEFLEYAEQDIVALRQLAIYMMDRQGISAYEWREHLIMAINAQMTRNGFAVDLEDAQTRVDQHLRKKDELMKWLVEEYDFPTEGKAPWSSAAGKEVILKVLADHGITPETHPEWERTKTGNISLSGDAVIELTIGTEAEEFARNLATLKGQRPLAQLALDSTHTDGKVHPNMTSLQRSGRFSMTKPSLPIWGSRTEALAEDKRYFIASPGRKLVEMDYSNADQRIVAALSGDKNYLERFVPGADGHEISGRLMFGDEFYESQMLPGWQMSDKIRKENPLRHIAKALSHAFAYNAGPKTLAKTSKLPENPEDPEMEPLKLAYKFIDAMNRRYPDNKRWREDAYEEGLSGWIWNDWGRRMPVDKDRSYTQSPGLLGQSGTREIMCDGLIRIAIDKIEVLRWLVATVHDAVIWDIPESEIEWAVPYIQSKMETTFQPKRGGQPVHFPMSAGAPADTWLAAGH